MVSLQTVNLVEGLLAEKVSGRQTAIRAGVARGTVSRIASGRWGEAYRTRMVRRMNRELKSNGKTMRCPGCGAKVKLPCRACRVRGLLAAGRLGRTYGRTEADGPLAVEIRDPDDRRRYEEVRARKRQESPGDGEAVWQPFEENDRQKDAAETTDDEPTEEDLASIDAELSEQLAVGSGQRKVGSGQWAVDSEEKQDPTAHRPPPTPHCPPPTPHSPLPTAHSPLPTDSHAS